MAYLQLEDLIAYLGISGAGDDALLSSFLPAAQIQIDKRCRRTFEALTDTTRYYRASDLDFPQQLNGLRYAPNWDAVYQTRRSGFLDLDADLIAVTTIVNGDGTEITPDQYWLYPLNESPKTTIQLKSSVMWNIGIDDMIAITGRFAYSLEADGAIQLATKQLCAYWYRNKDNQNFDVISIPGGPGIQIPAGWPSDVEQILVQGNYIRPLGVV